MGDIPLTNLVFSVRAVSYGPSFLNRKGKKEGPYLTVRTEKTRLVRYSLYLYCFSDGLRNDFYSRGTTSNF